MKTIFEFYQSSYIYNTTHHSVHVYLTIPMGGLVASKLFNTNYTLRYKLCNRNIHTVIPEHTPAGIIENLPTTPSTVRINFQYVQHQP